MSERTATKTNPWSTWAADMTIFTVKREAGVTKLAVNLYITSAAGAFDLAEALKTIAQAIWPEQFVVNEPPAPQSGVSEAPE